MKILVVDDDPTQREVISAVLTARGNTVLTAASGEAAVTLLTAADELDVIFMDQKMPGGITGSEATTRIRQMAGWRGKVPIVAMSASELADGDRNSAQYRAFLLKGSPEFHTSLATAAREVSEGPSDPPWFVKAKIWYWVAGALIFFAGSFSTVFYKFTGYYLAEQTSVASLAAVGTGLGALTERLRMMDDHLISIDRSLALQTSTNQAVALALQSLDAHTHALDARADQDRSDIAKMHEDLATQTQQILFLLDPIRRKGKL